MLSCRKDLRAGVKGRESGLDSANGLAKSKVMRMTWPVCLGHSGSKLMASLLGGSPVGSPAGSRAWKHSIGRSQEGISSASMPKKRLCFCKRHSSHIGRKMAASAAYTVLESSTGGLGPSSQPRGAAKGV